MSEKSLARHVQQTIWADQAYERPAYQTCLSFVRRHYPSIKAARDGDPDFATLVREDLVLKARESFRRVTSPDET